MQDKFRNLRIIEIKKTIGVEVIKERILKWLGYVRRMTTERILRSKLE